MFAYKTVIKLHQTDAAGLLFFSHQFEIIHDAYEALLEKAGVGFATLIRHKDYFLPIVHAEADYKAPLFVGDRLTIEVRVGKIGRSSFSFVYKLWNANKKLVGTAKTIHVTTDKRTRRAIPLPRDMKSAIRLYR